MNGRDRNRLAACIIFSVGAVVVGCAAVPPERAAIDARAASARTAAEHRAVADEYEALAQRAIAAARRYESYAEQDRATEDLIDRARARPDRPRISFHAPWDLDARAEMRTAEEARELARRHRQMAASMK